MLYDLEKLYPWSEGLPALLSDYAEEALTTEEYRNLQDYFASTDFYTAPASTRYHLCCPAGLMTHTLNVIRVISELVYSAIDYKEPLTYYQLFWGRAVKCAILHDLCKVDCYTPEIYNYKFYSSTGSQGDTKGTFDWKQGVRYIYNAKMDLGHGAKSLFAASEIGINLSAEETQAIYYHMGDFHNAPETSKVFAGNRLALLLHMADLYASSALDLSAEESKAYAEKCLNLNPSIFW